MALTIEEVEHIAELAKLALTDEEKKRFAEQLSDVLDYAARLNALDTDDIPPTASVLPVDTVLRADKAEPGLSPETVTAGSEGAEQNMFRVDAVMEESA